MQYFFDAIAIDIDRYWAGLNSGPGSTWWANRLRDGSWAAKRRVGQGESERGRRLGEQKKEEWRVKGVGRSWLKFGWKFHKVSNCSWYDM